MKKKIKVVMMSLLAAITLFMVTESSATEADASPIPVSVVLPDNLKSSVIRQDYENESIFSFKAENGNPVFLFSVTRVTGDQWIKIKSQLQGAKVIKNESGFIYFVQKTNQRKIKGDMNTEYQQLLLQLDQIVSSIKIS